jgi:hypothetical protein
MESLLLEGIDNIGGIERSGVEDTYSYLVNLNKYCIYYKRKD